MESPSHQFLAGSALTGGQNRALCRRDLADQLLHFPHRGAVADDHGACPSLRHRPPQVAHFLSQATFLHTAPDLAHQIVQNQRLEQVVRGSLAESFDCRLQVAERGDQDDRGARTESRQTIGHLNAIDAGHHKVAEHNVGLVFPCQAQALLAVAGSAANEALMAQQAGEVLAEEILVVDQQNAVTHALGALPSSQRDPT